MINPRCTSRRNLGHVRTAENAQQALEVVETLHPQVILMDQQLLGMDGLELTRQLRKNSAFQDVIIIAVTAYAMKGDQESAHSRQGATAI